MLVTVRLFARLREITGKSELPVEIPDGYDVGALWEDFVGQYPALAAYRSSISCAVNEDYAKFTTPLNDGDDVAFLPPVSGGQPAAAELQPKPGSSQNVSDSETPTLTATGTATATLTLTATID